MKRVFVLLLAGVLLLTGCAVKPGTAKPQGATAQIELPALEEIRAAESYDEIKTQLLQCGQGDRQNDSWVSEEAVNGVGATNAASTYADYSDTNEQVDGVGEADIIKTDGTYIYMIGGNNLRIVKADGANSALVSETELFDLVGSDDENRTYQLMEMLVSGDRLTVMMQEDNWWSEDEYSWDITTLTHVISYDISDRNAPERLADTAQDGGYQTSRLLDGKVFLVTNKYLWDVDAEDDEKLFPCVYTAQGKTLLPAEQVYLCPQTESMAYTVISAVDVQTGEQVSVCAFTDGSETVYMNQDALYLTRSVYSAAQSEPYTKNQYIVVDYRSEMQTELRRVRLTDGKLVLDGSGTVPGTLLNQFSLDVYNGHLRLATTRSESSYSVYTDEENGWSNIKWGDSEQNTGVVILDESFRQVGKIDSLAKEERIYSVRFIGDVGYVVTYESIDPLFTLNLSDPTKPEICSELKVTGVSRYLDSYGEGLLLGFGEALDTNASSEGLQLNMFDVSNAAEVKLIAQQTLDAGWSEALYNHKAILVEPQKNLIAFPAEEDGYQIYGYEDGRFFKKGEFKLDVLPDEARGLYIGSCFYICAQELVYAVDMNSFSLLASVNFAVG